MKFFTFIIIILLKNSAYCDIIFKTDFTRIKRMKKIFLTLLCAIILYSCGESSVEQDKSIINNEKDGDYNYMKIITYSLGANMTNCYLVYDENSRKACLIDPGEYDGEIMDAILSNELSLEYIILTHGHFDHILGADIFREKTGAKIAAHELEAEYLNDPEKSMTFFYGSETLSADILLKDNDIIAFGDISLKLVHTPGHTKGSSCFINKDEKIMFSGDTLFKGNIGRYDFYGGNYAELLESLRKLKALNENYKIYSGHGDTTSLDDEIAKNPYFR